MKPIMNKLNWKHGDLIVRVEEFKEKLKEAQSIVEKDPYNKEVKFNDVEALFVYNEVVKDEENLLAQEARVEWTMSNGNKEKEVRKFINEGKLYVCSIIETHVKEKIVKETSRQSIICHVESNYGNVNVFCTFVYASNNATKRRLSWKDLYRHKRICGVNPWVIVGYMNVTLNLEEHCNGGEDLFSNVLSNDEAEEMIKEVSDKEIKDALFDIGDNKAPGLDGFSSVFFKKAWNVVGKDVCDGIKEFFSKGQMLGELNATLITLIPKIQNPLKVSKFKPIACCNVLYKCISKILTNRIKGALKKLVQNNQSAFILGRLIQDNILLSQEILRDYGRKNGPKRCDIKIDLQKAYDTISWSFLETILYRHGYFKGDRGLRQGDPISSYLFTLVMEMLALLLQRKIMNNDGFKYHHGCKELKIINLCFADDLMIFCHGDIKSPGVINDAIKEFSAVSGLHPNMNKSSLLFDSFNIIKKGQLMSVMKFKEGAIPSRYLGVPLVTKRIGVKD
ncbi:RNA-directed DNA polymerase, eukaryota, reverse transcriptase zinc-binding domain protein [Tanacetum coccineum]